MSLRLNHVFLGCKTKRLCLVAVSHTSVLFLPFLDTFVALTRAALIGVRELWYGRGALYHNDSYQAQACLALGGVAPLHEGDCAFNLPMGCGSATMPVGCAEGPLSCTEI